ncbi:MAG: hypothetical protein ACI4PU_02925 [Intestinibacter sp.]
MILGCVGCAVAMILNTTIPYVVIGLICSLAGLFVVSLLTKNKENDEEKNLA